MEGAMSMSKEPSAVEKMIGDFAPKLADLTDRVLFGDVWERPELSKRDRSLATVAALIALHRPEQLRFHLGRGFCPRLSTLILLIYALVLATIGPGNDFA
jgi:alkylhydroperoxidase/carboxymuconolactone decarboxylase family protein YurZ